MHHYLVPLSGSLSPKLMFFWVRARRGTGQCLTLRFSVMHSLTRHSRQISLHPHILSPPLPPLSILLPFLFASEGSIPQNHWLPQIHKVSCSSQCIRTVMFHMYILKVAMYSRIRHQPFQKLNQNMIAVIRSIIWSKTHI